MPRESSNDKGKDFPEVLGSSEETSADTSREEAIPNIVFITKTIQCESSSSITWIHLPTTSNRFLSEMKIDLIPATSDSDFMSPDLGKLCEKFFNLGKVE